MKTQASCEPISIDDYHRDARSPLLPECVVEGSDYPVRFETSPYKVNAHYGDEYLFRVTDIEYPEPKRLRLFSRELIRLTGTYLSPDCFSTEPEKTLAIDLKGKIRWRGRFLTRLINPQIGYIKSDNGRFDRQFRSILAPPPGPTHGTELTTPVLSISV